MVWLRVTMGAGEPNVGCFLGNGLVGVFGFVWAIATGGAGSGGVVAACVAATRLRWAVVGCNAFLRDEVVAGLGLLGRWVVVRVHVGVVALVVVPAIGLRAVLWLKRLVPQARLGGASLELWLVCIHPVG